MLVFLNRLGPVRIFKGYKSKVIRNYEFSKDAVSTGKLVPLSYNIST